MDAEGRLPKNGTTWMGNGEVNCEASALGAVKNKKRMAGVI